jgi:DNA-binding transcriptional ArsR family regulator
LNRPSKNSPSALDRVFGALSDPTRRAILDLLRERGDMAAGEIGERFDAISRPAVSKHLRVLREAKLVEERREGRNLIYRLPDRLLAEPADAWLEPFRAMWREKLLDLKRFVEMDQRID